MAVTKYVKYSATAASERVLTVEDFERNGIKGQKGAKWDNLNGWRVPVSAFTKEALELVLRQPGLDLVEETANDDGTQV